MSSDGVSKVELAARLDSLVFPGSERLQGEGYDEGEGWGFDGIMQTPWCHVGMRPRRART
jgi:hypothetical protein